MLETLKFVRGAVSSKDLVPVLTHFLIANGRIQGANGNIALDAACPELVEFNLAVPADKFLRAVDACEGEPKVTLDAEKRVIRVSRGRFRASLATLDPAAYPRAMRRSLAHTVRPEPDFLPALERVVPYMSNDASRPWSCSVRLEMGYAIATANVVLARAPVTWPVLLGSLNLPSHAVNEIVRIGERPSVVEWDDNVIQVEYANGTWFQAQQMSGDWPNLENLVKLIDTDLWQRTPVEFAVALRKLKPFFPDVKMPVVVLSEDGISTQEGAYSATIETESLPKSAFRYEPLELVAVDATHWAPQRYPAAVPFKGHGIDGLISGVAI